MGEKAVDMRRLDRQQEELTPREKFRNALYFFNWLANHEETCDGCGNDTVMVGSIFNCDYKPWLPPDIMRFCEICWSNLEGRQ